MLGLVLGWFGKTSKPPRRPPLVDAPDVPPGMLSNARFTPDGHTIVYSGQWNGDPLGVLLYRTLVGSPEILAFRVPGRHRFDLVLGRASDSAGKCGGTLALVPMAGGTPRQVLENVSYQGADFSRMERSWPSHPSSKGSRVSSFPSETFSFRREPLPPRVAGRPLHRVLDADQRLLGGGRHRPARRRGADAVGRMDRARRRSLLERRRTRIWFSGSEPGLPSLGAQIPISKPSALWAVSLSGKRRLVVRVPGSLELYDVSRDGRALLGHHTDAQLVRFASASDPKERDLSWLDGSFIGDLSSDGKTILLNESGEASRSGSVIYLRSTDGSPAVKLGEGVGCALSPDGKWVLAQSPRQSGKAAILSLLPTGAGQPQALAGAGFAALGWAAWLSDGRSVIYAAAAEEGNVRLYRQTVPDGQPQPIGPDKARLIPATNPVSPDAKCVIGIRAGEVLLISLDGTGQARVLPGVSPGERVVQWSRGFAQRVRVSSQRPAREGVHRRRRDGTAAPLEGDSGRQVTPYVAGSDHPDGNAWAYWSRRILSELYLVEGLR